MSKCNHIFRVPVYENLSCSLGQCNNEALPGLVCCLDHAHKETLWLYIQMLLKEIEQLKAK